jgi:menaquinone-dependent protoporphyrinogen oxidase
MKRILVAYSTNVGSTAEVAETIGQALQGPEAAIEVRRLEEVRDLGGYEAVVLGGPMIVGWHRRAARFLRARRRELARVPVALFFTAMQVTRTSAEQQHGFPVLLDPRLVSEPARPGHLSFKERNTTVASYLRPIRTATPGNSRNWELIGSWAREIRKGLA